MKTKAQSKPQDTDTNAEARPAEKVAQQGDLKYIPISQIKPDPQQPRVEPDKDAMTQLIESIREYGILQPISVRPVADGEFMIVGGHRRYGAAKELKLEQIPCLVLDIVNEDDSLSGIRERQLTENFARLDLAPLDKALAISDLKKALGGEKIAWKEIEKKLGISETARKESLRLLKLPPKIQDKIRESYRTKKYAGRITTQHAKALFLLQKDAKKQAKLLEQFLEGKASISSEAAVSMARELRDDAKVNAKGKKNPGVTDWTVNYRSIDEFIRKLEEKLKELKSDEASATAKEAKKGRKAKTGKSTDKQTETEKE